MTEAWTKVATREALSRTGRMVVRVEGRQLALFEANDQVLACNNRCPHEGYPLSEGTLDAGCTLTCNWHNWKFDLASGDNLYGGDRLRTYPVQLRGDEIWADLSEAPFAERHAQVMHALRDAFDDNDYARIARELGRLKLIGGDPLDAARAAIQWSYDRMEFGWTHAYAGLADWLSLRAQHADDDEIALACLLEGVAHVADDVLREQRYPYASDVQDYDEEAFVRALEQQDEARAVALLRGALESGADIADVERGLARAALAHYNAFGHSAIYLTKVRPLVAALGDSVAEPLLVALVRQIVYARREDLIPEFRDYADALARFGQAHANAEPAPTIETFRGLGIAKALQRTAEVSAVSSAQMFDALLGVNAANLLNFDDSNQSKTRISVSDNRDLAGFYARHHVRSGGARTLRSSSRTLAERASSARLLLGAQRALRSCERRTI